MNPTIGAIQEARQLGHALVNNPTTETLKRYRDAINKVAKVTETNFLTATYIVQNLGEWKRP